MTDIRPLGDGRDLNEEGGGREPLDAALPLPNSVLRFGAFDRASYSLHVSGSELVRIGMMRKSRVAVRPADARPDRRPNSL